MEPGCPYKHANLWIDVTFACLLSQRFHIARENEITKCTKFLKNVKVSNALKNLLEHVSHSIEVPQKIRVTKGSLFESYKRFSRL